MTIKTKFGNANISDEGYYRITSEKEGNRNKLLHRLIFEDHCKVTICPWAIVHHKDGNKLNNFPDNLEILSRREHPLRHRNPMLKDEARVIKNGFDYGKRVWSLRWDAKRMKRSFNKEMLEMMADEINTF